MKCHLRLDYTVNIDLFTNIDFEKTGKPHFISLDLARGPPLAEISYTSSEIFLEILKSFVKSSFF